MATNKEDLQLMAANDAIKSLITPQETVQAVAPATAKVATAAKKATTVSSASNYESNRPTYEASDDVESALKEANDKEAAKPGEYTSDLTDDIQALIDQALNRAPFSYDFSKDPMYAMYADRYQQQGKTAMKGAMGEAAALTGGYGSSYGQSVGQQTYQQYLTGLNDVLPELRDSAYQQYTDEGTKLGSDIAMLQGQEATQYGRYRDTVSDYYTELNYFREKYQDMSDSEYNRYLNDVAAWESDRAYYYQKEQDAWTRAQAEAAARKSGGGGGSGGSSKTEAQSGSIPTTYSEFVALTGQSGVMSEAEYGRRNGSTGGYANYLRTMWAKYM